jgi:hypothetical protein
LQFSGFDDLEFWTKIRTIFEFCPWRYGKVFISCIGSPRVSRVALFLAAAFALLSDFSCLAVARAQSKQPTEQRSAQALKADELFWETLHGGRYDAIAAALDAETSAYLADPSDAKTAAHTGWLHIWRVAERARITHLSPTITDDLTLARKYFAEAVALDPGEARFLGFLASATLGEAAVHRDTTETRRGNELMLAAIKAWPEFNLFTAGYVMSGQPADSDLFRQALDRQWQNIDICVGEKIDRSTGEFKYTALETREGAKRVCWNSWIAPHNFEGFFMNMGDMIAKSGDWKLAQKLYANARLSKTYNEWPYRDALEARIRDAEANVVAFNDEKATGDGKKIMRSTSFSCVACHQN